MRPAACSWAALASWSARFVGACLLISGLLFGPELADNAWQRGAHVTPVQAAVHAALTAAGLAHHHGSSAAGVDPAPGTSPVAASRTAAFGAVPLVERASGGFSWGTSLLDMAGAGGSRGVSELRHMLAGSASPEPLSVTLVPLSPPPEMA